MSEQWIVIESHEIKTMRYMEWERAKGNLRAILASFWEFNPMSTPGEPTWDDLCDMVEKFIREFGEAAGLD